MAGISQDISIQVNNSLDRKATVTLLGGTQDPSNGQANAKTLYEWDLSAESFSNTTVVEIQASTVTNPEVISYRAVNQDGEIRSLRTVVSLLNTLNLGTFNLDGTTIFILDDINIFGNLSVQISQDFNIDTFVESGYNYFDPESKTTLVDFSTKFKPLIEQAVNTIPTFVEFIETQGWSLAFVFESSTLRFNRSVSGDVYHISDNLGTLTTTKYSGTNNINTNTFQKSLLFVSDINIFTTCTLFEANALTSVQSVIYKYVFGNIFVNFNQDSLVVAGWKPLSPNYFPTINGTHIIKIDASDTNVLDDYGNSFPSVNQINTSSTLNFIGVNSGTEKTFFVGTAFADAELNFGNSASISTTRISKIESLNGSINVNFATLIYNTTLNKLDSVQFKIFFGDSSPQNVTLDSAFNEKFRKTSETDFNALQLFLQGTLGGSNFPQLNYADDTTPLQVNVDEINFRNTYTANLPPIQVLGGYDGSATVFNLDLDIQYQANPSNFSMRYFNDWFYKVGTQDAIYNQNIVSGTRLIEAENNTFLLSGRGLQGYYSLTENNYTVNIPTGTLLTGGSLSFTTRPNPPTIITLQTVTAGLGQSDFEITYSEVGQTDTVQASSFFALNQEQLQIANSGNELNVLMTQRPSLNTTNFNIGSFGSYDQFSTMLFTGTLFNFPISSNIVSINGFTLDMPIYDAVANEVDARGLYQRDFSSAFGGTLNINLFKINGTKIGNPTLQPYGDNKIINSTVVFNSFNNINFNSCFFGTDLVDDTLNDILNLLLPSSAIAFGGITFESCNFNGVNNSLSYLEVTFPLASPNLGTQGLNGTSEITNTQFSQTQPDRILFTSDWAGIGGYAITTLTVSSNSNLEQINLQNSNTATPNALNLIVQNNSSLEVLNFTNHNITQLTFNNNPLINNIDLSGNNLPDAEIDDLLNQVNSYGTSNGTINYSSQTGGGVPTAIGSGTAYNNLISRGWTLVGASPFGLDVSTYTVASTQSFAKTSVSDFQLNEDGTLIYLSLGTSLEKYTLSTANDITTISATPTQSITTGIAPNFVLQNGGVYDSGNYYYVALGGQLRRWDFGTPNDLTTISAFTQQTTSGNFFGVKGFTFNPTGTIIYAVTNTNVKQFNLSSAWDITTETQVLDVPISVLGLTLLAGTNARTIKLNSAGTDAFIFARSSAGTTSRVYQFSLSTPFSASTLSYVGLALNNADTTPYATEQSQFNASLSKVISLYCATGSFPRNSVLFKEWS